VYTIHTPVSAGNERFDAELVRRIASPVIAGTPLTMDRLLEIGRGADDDPAQFDMTAFSLRLTTAANAVSQLHAETANTTWTTIPGHAILGITNGVHAPSWVGASMRGLFEGVGGDLDDLDDEEPEGRFWERLDRVSDEKLWEHHLEQKLALAFFARGRLRNQLARHGESPGELSQLTDVLDPSILTIGFARRFATYKRAALLLSDEERLARLLWDTDRPLQIVFAGKAHPADRPGQRMIQDIFGRSRSSRLKGRVFILEDYDMREGRYLVQGVDVWLNNPRRPLEASGTSGMKAAMNGVPNLSILDGGWPEGCEHGVTGWKIGDPDPKDDAFDDKDNARVDKRDREILHNVLEKEVLPAYADRGRWLAIMRASIAMSQWRFSSDRMVEDYMTRVYSPAR
jgi:starch phosphorylase